MKPRVNLFYLSNVAYGGWATYTAQLHHALTEAGCDVRLYKIGKTNEKRDRPFGWGICYQNVDEFEPQNLPGFNLITCVAKKFSEQALDILTLCKDRAAIVVHDPTELKGDMGDWVHDTEKVILIRPSMKNHVPHGRVVPHPYKRLGDESEERTIEEHAVCFSRIDFDKNTHMILEANDMIADERFKVKLYGYENRMYAHTKIMPRWKDWVQSKRHFPKDWDAAFQIARKAGFVVDLSVIKGDGGSTQYTFLEALDAGAPLILHREWFYDPWRGLYEFADDVFMPCVYALIEDPGDLAKLLTEEFDLDHHRHTRAWVDELFARHEPKRIGEMVRDILEI